MPPPPLLPPDFSEACIRSSYFSDFSALKVLKLLKCRALALALRPWLSLQLLPCLPCLPLAEALALALADLALAKALPIALPRLLRGFPIRSGSKADMNRF